MRGFTGYAHDVGYAYDVPAQDLTFPLLRMPAKPLDRMLVRRLEPDP